MSNKNTFLNAQDLLWDMITVGRQTGFIHYEMREVPDIPDLSMQQDNVSEVIFQRIAEYSKDHPEISPANVAPAFCLYAGMGAVELWRENRERLLARGIAEELIAGRGLEKMDEYVLDLCNIVFGSKQADELMEHMNRIEATGVMAMQRPEAEETLYLQFLEFMKAMYLYGIVLEMDRNSMHSNL